MAPLDRDSWPSTRRTATAATAAAAHRCAHACCAFPEARGDRFDLHCEGAHTTNLTKRFSVSVRSRKGIHLRMCYVPLLRCSTVGGKR